MKGRKDLVIAVKISTRKKFLDGSSLKLSHIITELELNYFRLIITWASKDNIIRQEGNGKTDEKVTFKMGEIDLGYGYLYILVILATLVPSLSVGVRRLHDVGKSGWFTLIVLIPIIGAIWLLVLYCTDGVPGPNKWGSNPKGIGNASSSDLIDSIGQ